MKMCVPVTNRTNYSKLKPVLTELKEQGADDIRIVISSSILLDRLAAPYHDIEADGFAIDKKIDCILMNDSHEAMAKTTGLSMIEHATYFENTRPDMLLVVGDRFDMLSPVVAAAMMNIPIAHIQGGEISGTIDNVIRDIVAKFASVHFVSTEKSLEKLVTWGIEKDRIFNYGCPAVEYIHHLDVGSHFDAAHFHKKFKRKIDIEPGEEFFLVMMHPDTTNDSDFSMKTILECVRELGVKSIVFYPNIDASNFRIVSDMNSFKAYERFYFVNHMPLEDFAHTMAHASCMISNSSAAIREAASFGVPVINIGDRQKGREKNQNTLDVECEAGKIRETIDAVRGRRFPRENLYYKPACAQNIARAIVERLNKNAGDFEKSGA
jgi:UDP-hydrolysing UDP-N-acetyl-D-glucosamine 2-epimerase